MWKKLWWISLIFIICLKSQQAYPVSLDVTSGWNLLSIPVNPPDKTIQGILGDNVESVISLWKWINSGQGNWAVSLPNASDSTKAYIQQKGFLELKDINAGEGFWVNAKKGFTISLEGQYPDEPFLALSKGWNLVGLKDVKTWDVEELFEGVKSSILSVWAWDKSDGNGNWAVYLPQYSDKGKAYAEQKGFSLLKYISPTVGFWVNASSSTPEFPPIPLELRVLTRADNRLLPVAGARVYLGDTLLADTNQHGIFIYPSSKPLNLTIEKEDFNKKSVSLPASKGRTHIILDPVKGVGVIEDENTKEEVSLPKKSLSKEFIEYPNLFIMEAIILESAKPTPKIISDKISSLIISNMKLKVDSTVAIKTWSTVPEKDKDAIIEDAQYSFIIAGADVLITDSIGNKKTNSEIGFTANVSVTIKNQNLSQNLISISEIKSKLENGTGRLQLYAKKENGWEVIGEAELKEKDGMFELSNASGVHLEGLYSFAFVFSKVKAVKGLVYSKDSYPLANALVYARGCDSTATTDQSGAFLLQLPYSYKYAQLFFSKENFYLTNHIVSFSPDEELKDIGKVELKTINKVLIKGKIVDQLNNPHKDLDIKIEFSNIPLNIMFPKELYSKTDAKGEYSFYDIPQDLIQYLEMKIVLSDGTEYKLPDAIPIPINNTIQIDITFPTIHWTFLTGGNIYATPIADDKNLYVGSVDGKMYCLNKSTGSVNWINDVSLAIFSKPSQDISNIYFGSIKNRLFAISKQTGNIAEGWSNKKGDPFADQNPKDIVSSPAIDSAQGLLVFGDMDGGLYYLNKEGITLKQEYVPKNISGGLSFYKGNIYFGSWDGRIYAYGAEGSTLQMKKKWQYPISGSLTARVIGTPEVYDGVVYIGGGNNIMVTVYDVDGKSNTYNFSTSNEYTPVMITPHTDYYTVSVLEEDKNLYAIDALDGSLKWHLTLDGAIFGKPWLEGNYLFVCTLNGSMYQIDITNPVTPNSVVWKFNAGSPIYSSPLVYENSVYFATENGILYCLDLTSKECKWKLKLGKGIISSPIASEGMLYVADLDGKVVCIKLKP